MINDREKTLPEAEISHEDSVWSEPTGGPASHTPLAGQVVQLEASLAEMRACWVRAEAENANIRARAKRDIEDMRRFAIEAFSLDVVEAAENLRRGLDKLPPASNLEPPGIAAIRAGLIETERGFLALLDRHGIKRIDPTGAAFDPNLHQAMAEQTTAGQAPGTILQVLSPTWLLNGRLLRAGMVIIAKAKPEATEHAH